MIHTIYITNVATFATKFTVGVFPMTGWSIEIIYNIYRNIIEAKEPMTYGVNEYLFLGSNKRYIFSLGFPFWSSMLSSTATSF